MSGSDLFSVIRHRPLLPSNVEDPAKYDTGETLTLDRDSTVDDICDFVVEYINSDVLVCILTIHQYNRLNSKQGLLSDRLLVIAGMLKSRIIDSLNF